MKTRNVALVVLFSVGVIALVYLFGGDFYLDKEIVVNNPQVSNKVAVKKPDQEQVLSPSKPKLSVTDPLLYARTNESGLTSINSVSFSPNGKLALATESDGTVRLWEVLTGRALRKLSEPNEDDWYSREAMFSLDSTFVVIADKNKLLLLDTSTGKELRTFPVSTTSNYSSLALSPDGRLFMSGSENGILTLWDIFEGKKLRNLGYSGGAVVSIVFSPDGSLVLSSTKNNTKLWKLSTGKKLHTFEGTFFRGNVDFSPDGRLIRIASEHTINEYDVNTGKKLYKFTFNLSNNDNEYDEHIRAFSISANLAISSYIDSSHKTLKLWEVSTGKKLHTFTSQVIYSDTVSDMPVSFSDVAFSPDNKHILSATYGDLDLYDVSGKRHVHSFGNIRSPALNADISPDGHTVCVNSSGDRTMLWDLDTGNAIRALELPQTSLDIDELRVSRPAFSSNGHFIFLIDWYEIIDGNDVIHLWDWATGKIIKTWHTGIESFTASDVSPDSRFALIGGDFDKLSLWDIATEKKIRSFNVHSGKIAGVAFSPDGNFILYIEGKEVSRVQIWNTVTGKKIRSFNLPYKKNIQSVIFSLDGRSALIFIQDKKGNYTVDLWEIATGKLVDSIHMYDSDVLSVLNAVQGKLKVFAKFSIENISSTPDGRLAVKPNGNEGTEVWDVASKQQIIRMISTHDGEWSVSTPDGYYNTSPEGKSAIYYVSGTETYGFEQFESLFRRPDIIKARLAGDLTAGTPAPKLTRPPRVTADPTRSMQTTTDQATYPLAVTATSQDDVVKTVRVFVNGKPAIEQPVDAKEQQLNFTVPLYAGPNRITTVAYDSKGFSSNQESIDIVSTVPGAAKPTLYVMAAGVSTYPNMPAANQLEYAHSDANALVQALRDQKGKLFQDVRDFTMINQEVTSQQLEAGLTALSAMDANDIAVIFLAGHGVQGKDGRFWYVTPQGSMEHPEQGGLDWQILGERITHVKGRVILFLDACHSGSIVDETIVPNDQLAAKFFQGGMGGVMVFSASKGRQTSIESPDIGGGFGAFTYALTQGLGPKATEADKDNNGFVEFMELVDYVSKTVNTLTAGQQTPWLSRKELFGDLAIAMVKK